MLRAALVTLAAFVLLSVLGGRAEVSVLSGTVMTVHGGLLGLGYAVAWFAGVLLAPPLLIASGYGALTRPRRAGRPSQHDP